MIGNQVTVVGNLTREFELRSTPAGNSVANAGVAVNRRYKKQTGEEVEETSFLDIVCWGTLAENASKSLPKGARVIVTGRLEQRTWETENNEKRSKVEIIADEVSPSLRWATADVTKAEFSNSGGYTPSAQSAPAPPAGAAANSVGTNAATNSDDNYEEEAF